MTITRLLTTLLTITISAMSIFASTPRRPDFAFPEKVSTEAEKQLARALDSGDDIVALRAAINLTLAQNAIDSDRMPESLARLDSLAAAFSKPAPLAVCNLLKATIYTAYFRSQQWAIENRPDVMPGSPAPADYTQWNAAQFQARVAELLNAALANPQALFDTPLKNYDALLDVPSRDARIEYTFYPSLLDFVGGQAVDLISSFRTSDARALASEYRSTLIRMNAQRPAPLVVNRIAAILPAANSNDYSERLIGIYEEMRGSQFSGEALIALGHVTDFDNIDACIRLKTLIDNFLTKYPAYLRADNLRNLLADVMRQRVTISNRTLIVPGNALHIKATGYNTASATVTLYRLPDSYRTVNEDYYSVDDKKNPLSSLKAVGTCRMSFPGSLPFRAEVSDSITVPTPGLYIAVAEAPGMRRDDNFQIIRATYLATGSISFGPRISAWVVNPLTGRPADGATLQSVNLKSTSDLGVTDASGLFDLSDSSGGNLRIRAVNGPDRFSPVLRVWPYSECPDTARDYSAYLYTDLAIYHPGDTMSFAAIVYSEKERDYRVEPGLSFSATLFDANHQPVDTLTDLVTDRFGRITGRFTLPDDGRLNGNYSLRISNAQVSGSIGFLVSDYKLPSFEVKVTETATGTPVKGAVTLRGTAMTYSGMPLQNARIEIKVSRAIIWRWWDRSSDFEPVTLSGVTDDNGKWSIEIGADLLAPAGKDAWFEAEVTATSTAGESQDTHTIFTLGPAIRLEAPLKNVYDVSKPVTLPVRAVNTKDELLPDISISYTITSGDSDKAVASGSFLSGKPEVDWSSIAPGTYTITFACESDTVKCAGIALYRPDINRSPSDNLLWTPSANVTLGIDGVTPVTLGTAMDTTYVLYTLYDAEHIIERKMLALPAGLHIIKTTTLRGGSEGLCASFVAAGRYRSQEIKVSIKPQIDPRTLKLRAESMRDRVTPGSAEKWTFTVVNATGVATEAAVMIDMYNKALDALTPHDWSLNIYGAYGFTLGLRNPVMGYYSDSYLRAMRSSRLREYNYYLPEFQLYGQSLAPQTFRNRYFRSARMMAAGAVMNEAKYEVVEDSDDGVSNLTLKAAAPAPSPEAGGAGFSDSPMEEETAESAASADNRQKEPEFAYRDSETPLALFRPMLTTGRDGRLELQFTVPNANATWAFQALAWTADMRVADFDASVLASKPVMVKPNAPRFLREGDKAVLLTSVMNATDSLQQVTALIEIYNPLTGATISTVERSIELEPRSTVTVSADVEATPGSSVIGFRAKASTATFADGEQIAIPVLPASTPVVDSEPFYLGPDTHEADVIMPASKDAKDAFTTLEFCENPVWYVVTALPGLSAKEPVTSTEAAGALFSAAVARGLIARYPAIAETLRDWTARGSSSEELTSMLERNQDLKTMLLSATPWVMDAQSDTERMQRLALLFDSKRVASAISSSIDKLSKLSRDEGGWAWIDRISEPSEWGTTEVLGLLASLDEFGFTPDNKRLAAMVTDAVHFLDAKAAERYARDPKSPQISYALLRSAFPTVKASTTTDKILAAATQSVVSGWKQWQLGSKPEAAMLLWRRGYKSVAHEILSSMREFMVTSTEHGTYFPSLQNQAYGYLSYTADALRAFATIDPGCPEIDGLRHWLVIQKQATDWGSSPYATEVICAILSSSQSWLTDAKGATVKVNGRSLDVPVTDRSLGYFRMPLDVNASKQLTVAINKPAETPAWGAVIRRSILPLTAVEASGSDDISIEKSIIGPDTLSVGDKVTVRLVIRTGRNLNYVAITDARAACFEPVEQLPSTQFSEGVCFYLEPRDSQTDIFITTMPKGTYVLSYDLYVNNAGSFASGIATAASQYAPELSARSAGSVITVNP